MPAPRVIVLDFDGTMTDAEAEGAPFFAGYVGDLALLTGGKPDDVRARALALRDEMFADPAAYAAEFGTPPEAVARGSGNRNSGMTWRRLA